MFTFVATKMTRTADRWRETDLLGKLGYATLVLIVVVAALFGAYFSLLTIALNNGDFGPR